jgi:uncharacterized small protein (DUF1192 family)
MNERQVSTHADMCKREVNETEPDFCLICRERMSISGLYDHLATHMEELALFVLPLTPDDSPDEHSQELTENNSQPDSLTGEIETGVAADTAEVARKAAEDSKKNASGSDADEPPLTFTDAVDRRFTLPWHLVKTWKGMETLIRQAFVNIERIGPHFANGHYHLLGPNGEIILPQVWDIVVQPGWDIKMQMWPLPPSPTPSRHVSPSVIFGHDDLDDPVVEIPEDARGRGQSGIRGRKSSAGSTKKTPVPAFTRWMLGSNTRSRPKRADKPAADV